MKNNMFDELVVVKRSGQRVDFNNYKIAVAIKHAFDSVYESYDEKNINKVFEDVLKYIEETYVGRKTINVEDIQDIIETKLKEEKYFEVYKAFHEYRQKRAASRKVFTIKGQHKFIKAMETIAEDNSLKSENSLKPQEILLNYGQTVVSEFTKAYLIDNKYLRSHEEGNIFIHDMESFPLGIFSGVHLILNDYLEKTNSIADLIAEVLKVKTEVKGEVNIPAIDYLFEKYFERKYKKYLKENIKNYLTVTGFAGYLNIKKIMEIIDREAEMSFNREIFSQFLYADTVQNIFLQSYEDALSHVKEKTTEEITKVFEALEQSKDGKFSISFGTNKSYKGTIINQLIFEVLMKKGPLKNLKIIFKVKKDNLDFLDKIYDLITLGHELGLAFTDNSYNSDASEIEYFFDGIRIFENINSGFREANGRLNVASTSINMSRLGLKNSNKPKEFYKELDDLLELAKNNLLLSFETIGNKTKDNYQILFNNNILDDEKLEPLQKIRKVIKNGNLFIGIIGLKECVLAISDDSTKQFKWLLDILNYLNKKCNEFSNDTRLNFYICEPEPGIAHKEFMTLDKAVYGFKKGITEKGCYDLISNLDVIKKDYKKQGMIQKLFVGGNILKINLNNNYNQKRFKELINELINADIGFVKINRKQVEDK